ncbi:alkaline phosphatase family protein [Paenibacillus camelliae]|uniref:alkaline phosphatase family protein n=1 Tax=Paenibacillus camelliae TaxID=512410 RepID=UPI00203EC825|nr:alkaline phosphatase family protein [Paenibacillus camelliae]MCM3634786.1 alkaline phosphatase family protein [Paenibacillus camelliae]
MLNNAKASKKLSMLAAILLLLLSVVMWLIIALSITQERSIAAPIEKANKPVIVLLFDSLMNEPMQAAVKEGMTPAISYLMKHGTLYPEVVSAYPTMSVSIDSTILTGSYADKHRIPGLIWFNESEQQIVSYGSGPHEIWDNGVKQVLQNSILKLNGQHLSDEVKTIHERLAEAQIQSASINGLIYRGNTPHTLTIPGLLSRSSLMPSSVAAVNGPDLLSLGVLAQYNKKNDQHNLAWDRLGINNKFTVQELAYLIQNDKLPAFTLAYFPDTDATLHKHGPQHLQAIKTVDETIQSLFNLYPSWDQALEEAVWIVLGDSGQSLVLEDKERGLINMNELLSGYSLWSKKHPNGQLAFALNERMGYIHILDEQLPQEELIQRLKQEKRIQFIAWHKDGVNYVASPEHEQLLIYKPNGPYRDSYQQTWNIAGDLSLLSLTLDDKQQLYYEDYPDALARLHGALHTQEGNFIIIDAKPSYEFSDHHSYNHTGGGSHGSLHKVDSLVPLIAAGTTIELKDTRLVALQEWLLSIVLGQNKL